MKLIEFLTELSQNRHKCNAFLKVTDSNMTKRKEKFIDCGSVSHLLECLSDDCLQGDVVDIYTASSLFYRRKKYSPYISIEIKKE